MVTLQTLSGSSASFSCFEPDNGMDPCSAEVCQGDFSDLIQSSEEESLTVKICSFQENSNLASIWEINFSSSNETNKIQGMSWNEREISMIVHAVFQECSQTRLEREWEALQILRRSTDSWAWSPLRGVGKSTIASLLSGNSSMFTVGSGSITTTTKGFLSISEKLQNDQR